MSKKPSGSGDLPANLPENFFDSNKRSEKAQQDDLARELEQFEREMAALEAESEEKLKEQFEKLHDERSIDELEQQIEQWKRIVELEKKVDELQNKPISESLRKKAKIDNCKLDKQTDTSKSFESDDQDLDDIEDFEDKLFDWRSKGL